MVYFKNIHVLNTLLQNRLEYYLKASCLASRHKLLTSFTGDPWTRPWQRQIL